MVIHDRTGENGCQYYAQLWLLSSLIFGTLIAVNFRSPPVYSPERLLSSLDPCPFNTSPVKEKHRRVV